MVLDERGAPRKCLAQFVLELFSHTAPVQPYARARQHRAQVRTVRDAGEAMRREAATLVTALRKPQVRGSWGETTLKNVARLSGMVDALPGRVAQAEAAPLPHLEFLELLVEDELARRADRLVARRLKQAGITAEKTLADFDWAFNPKIPKTRIVELASARFVATHGGVLLIGPPGVGKSHVATAIAIGAIRAGRRALVRSTFDLAADFAQAEATGSAAISSSNSPASIYSCSRTSG